MMTPVNDVTENQDSVTQNKSMHTNDMQERFRESLVYAVTAVANEYAQREGFTQMSIVDAVTFLSTAAEEAVAKAEVQGEINALEYMLEIPDADELYYKHLEDRISALTDSVKGEQDE